MKKKLLNIGTFAHIKRQTWKNEEDEKKIVK